MDNYNLKRFRATKSLLSGDIQSHVKADIRTMNNYIYSGSELGDALAKYNSVVNTNLAELFKLLPLSVKLHDLFIGTRYLSYNYGLTNPDERCIEYWKENLDLVRNKILSVLHMYQMPIPLDIDKYDKHEILHILIKILKTNYWVEISNQCSRGMDSVIFQYNDTMYLYGNVVENNEKGYPIILINEK
jgi:hypothetical protein